jgi:hypothetical protein
MANGAPKPMWWQRWQQIVLLFIGNLHVRIIIYFTITAATPHGGQIQEIGDIPCSAIVANPDFLDPSCTVAERRTAT